MASPPSLRSGKHARLPPAPQFQCCHESERIPWRGAGWLRDEHRTATLKLGEWGEACVEYQDGRFFFWNTRERKKCIDRFLDSPATDKACVLANLSLNATPDIMQLTPSEQNRIRWFVFWDSASWKPSVDGAGHMVGVPSVGTDPWPAWVYHRRRAERCWRPLTKSLCRSAIRVHKDSMHNFSKLKDPTGSDLSNAGTGDCCSELVHFIVWKSKCLTWSVWSNAGAGDYCSELVHSAV